MATPEGVRATARMERILLARPQAAIDQLTILENAALARLRQAANVAMVSIQDQVRNGTKPADLVLPRLALKQQVEALTELVGQAEQQGRFTALRVISNAKNTRPQEGFAVWDVPADASAFVPQRGLDWYREYALRLVGIHDAGVLDRAKQVIIRGIRLGSTNEAMMAELGLVFTRFAASRLETIVRTESAKIYEHGKWEEYDREPEIVGYEFLAIMDTRTTDMCQARDGKKFPKDKIEGNLPPLHFRCRSTIAALFSWEIKDGTEKYDPVPKTAPPALSGFGTTAMEIPETPSRAVRSIVKQARAAVGVPT